MHNNINVAVGGPVNADYSKEYTTKFLKPGIPFGLQVTEENAKYVIKYNFDLGGERVTLPENCILEFDGGRIINGALQGYVVNSYLRPEWFGAKRDGVTDDTWAIQACIDLLDKYGGTTLLNRGYYKVSQVNLKTKTNLKGEGIGATIIKSDTASEQGIVNVLENSINCILSDLSIVGNKTQHGVYIYPVESKDGATYPMSYYLQEHTGIENNKQSYRNFTVENVYVGECNYGMYFNHRAYRTIVQKCDVKRCVYGIMFGVTDSDIHNIYIESCDRTGLYVGGANNNVTDVKSIWNGIVSPYTSYGMELRGNRNRFVNLEAQDNYCSGIASSGNENKYLNILANGDGYAYNPALDDEYDGMCEWYVNTLTSLYSNCTVCNYSTRQTEETGYEKPFPKYPIKYGADGLGTGQNIKIEGSTGGSCLAREPINIADILPCSELFDINSSAVTANPQHGYLIEDSGYVTPDIKRNILTSGQITMLFEFTLGDIENLTGNVVCNICGTNNYYIYVSPSKNIGFTRDNEVIIRVPVSDADFSKPIRIVVSITPRYRSNNKWYYDIEMDSWYYSSEFGCYKNAFRRVTNYSVERINTFSAIKSVRFNKLWTDDQPLNDFYLRTFMITENHDVPCSIAYPNAIISHLNPLLSFDYRSVNGGSRPNVGPTNRRPTSLVSKGYEYYDTDINKPLWFNGSEYVGYDDCILLTPTSNTNLSDLPAGKYKWGSSSYAEMFSDWPTGVSKSSGVLLSFFLYDNNGVEIKQLVLFTNTSGIVAVRRSNNVTWNLLNNIYTARSQYNAILGMCVFDENLGKPVWYNGTNWVDATGATV